MADRKALVYSILDFLARQRNEIGNDDVDDKAGSLEVAQQCLESVYGVTLGDSQCTQSLEDIFYSAAGHTVQASAKVKLTQEQKDKAEEHKTQGNDLVKQNKFQEALVCYTQAIQIDPSNAVYFSNRAAAYSKLEQHEHALNDCTRAITLDPHYSKAYGRKGLAHSALNQHSEAKSCYQKAMDLDPANTSYKTNLEIAEQKLREMPMAGGGGPMGGLNLGGMDFSSLLSNPALMNMATNMLSNPQMQELMANMMSGGGGGAGMAGEGEAPAGDGLSGLLHAGQQLAQQMQQSNPELVSQLRNQMREQGPPNPDESQ